MQRYKIGLILFWIGAVYMFVASWLIMWWVTPIWRNSPAEQFNGTIWAFGGPVFMFISFSTPLGIVLTAIGMLLYGQSKKPRMYLIAIAYFSIIISFGCSGSDNAQTEGADRSWESKTLHDRDVPAPKLEEEAVPALSQASVPRPTEDSIPAAGASGGVQLPDSAAPGTHRGREAARAGPDIQMWLAPFGYEYRFDLVVSNAGPQPLSFDAILLTFHNSRLGPIEPGTYMGVVLEQRITFREGKIFQTFSYGERPTTGTGELQVIPGATTEVFHYLSTGRVFPSQEGKEPTTVSLSLLRQERPVSPARQGALPSPKNILFQGDIRTGDLWKNGHLLQLK